MNDTREDVKAYWDSRAHLGKMAGTPDLIAKQIEMKTIVSCFTDDATDIVVDAGCGNAITAVFLKKQRPGLTISGFDNSEEMVSASRRYAKKEGADISFSEASVLDWTPETPPDVVYSERTIVNLPDWDAQRAAILRIIQNLKPGGTYLMMENCQDSVHMLNLWRQSLGLSEIKPPWHNRYMRDAEVAAIAHNAWGKLETIIEYSSMYYFLSRVVNAWQAKQENKKTEYDSPINELALKVPPSGIPNLPGQGRLWVWKANESVDLSI